MQMQRFNDRASKYVITSSTNVQWWIDNSQVWGDVWLQAEIGDSVGIIAVSAAGELFCKERNRVFNFCACIGQ